MYRILAADQPVRERRNQREHPQYIKPELARISQTHLGGVSSGAHSEAKRPLIPI